MIPEQLLTHEKAWVREVGQYLIPRQGKYEIVLLSKNRWGQYILQLRKFYYQTIYIEEDFWSEYKIISANPNKLLFNQIMEIDQIVRILEKI